MQLTLPTVQTQKKLRWDRHLQLANIIMFPVKLRTCSFSHSSFTLIDYIVLFVYRLSDIHFSFQVTLAPFGQFKIYLKAQKDSYFKTSKKVNRPYYSGD